jgi:nicotinate-nucleotide adenylyltransferase
MVRALLAEDQVLGVSEVELTRPGPSFTVDTLRYFRGLYPEGEIFFVMGVDQAATFGDWHEPEEVARLARLVVLAREGGTIPKEDFMTVPVTRVDISSSAVRARIREGKTVRHLVPEGVLRIIEEHSLYEAVS